MKKHSSAYLTITSPQVHFIPKINFDDGFNCEGMYFYALCKNLTIMTSKCTTAICMLAYGLIIDSVDEYVCIGESIVIECLYNFVKGVNEVFVIEYLRKPNNNYIKRLLKIGDSVDLPGMLGNIDRMHKE
ncbi:hypothetical protein CR513_16170, partial [Mucuna pruriens]